MLGVDGGGTRTRLVLMEFDESAPLGREVARSIGPSSLVHPLRPQDAAMTVCRMVEALLADVGADLPGDPALPRVGSLWAGLAGAGRSPIRSQVENALREALDGAVERVHVGTDAQAAYHDAFGNQPGILLIAGTGSGVIALTEQREAVRAGGWGPLLGDEGSGYAIGLSALRAVLAAEDHRGPPTAMSAVVGDLGLESLPQLVDWVASAEKAAIAALVSTVAESAAQGDAVARTILEEAAESLVDLVQAARSRGAPPTVAVVGGLLGKGGPLREHVRSALSRAGFAVRQRPVRAEVGAARLAWESAKS